MGMSNILPNKAGRMPALPSFISCEALFLLPNTYNHKLGKYQQITAAQHKSRRGLLMPIVTFQKLLSSYNVPPGKVHHWWWNNAPPNRVWLFSVDADVTSMEWPPDRTARAEVIRVENRYKLNPPEREIHFWVKNTDPSYHINYDIFMSTIRA